MEIEFADENLGDNTILNGIGYKSVENYSLNNNNIDYDSIFESDLSMLNKDDNIDDCVFYIRDPEHFEYESHSNDITKLKKGKRKKEIPFDFKSIAQYFGHSFHETAQILNLHGN